MTLRDRIFDLVFPGRRRRRKVEGRGKGPKPGRPHDDEGGYDSRYFVQRRR